MTPIETGSRRPDIYIIVMDCVSEALLQESHPTPFIDTIVRSGLSVPRAASVCPWTVPSHGSILTGLYPWQTGFHKLASAQLNSRYARLPTLLRSAGYRTILLSANPLLGGPRGLDYGFDQVMVGSWTDMYRRGWGGYRITPDHFGRMDSGALAGIEHGEAATLIPDWIRRYPFAWQTLQAVRAGALRGRRPTRSSEVAQWIEPHFRTLLDRTGRETPVFGLINLLDAHEPYLATSDDDSIPTDWLRLARQRQDNGAWISGEWVPTAAELSRLHWMARTSIRRIDRRVARIANVLKEAGRWENSLVILTSDHGQAFGEGGVLFHGIGTSDTLLRIPLVARFPHEEHGGEKIESWASLVDVLGTCTLEAGVSEAPQTSGKSLRELSDTPRSEPVFAVADGVVTDYGHAVPSERRRDIDRVSVVAYTPGAKLVLSGSRSGGVHPSSELVEIGSGGFESPSRHHLPVIESMREIYASLLRPGPGIPVPAATDSLASWGYC